MFKNKIHGKCMGMKLRKFREVNGNPNEILLFWINSIAEIRTENSQCTENLTIAFNYLMRREKRKQNSLNCCRVFGCKIYESFK